MKCRRCGLPVEPDDSQCGVCGEILTDTRETPAFDGSADNRYADPAFDSEAGRPLRMTITPAMQKFGVIWMVSCALFALVCILLAFAEFSTEAMWAAFIAAALVSVPILFIVLGRTVEVAYYFRKELTVFVGIGGAVLCFYLLARAIQKSNVRVETAGMQEMVTNENFTKTLITAIICITVIAALLPIGKMLLKGSAMNIGAGRYQADSSQQQHIRASENINTLELRKLELTHEIELRKLELEKERIRIEGERYTLLADNRSKLLIDDRDSDTPGRSAASPPPPPAEGS